MGRGAKAIDLRDMKFGKLTVLHRGDDLVQANGRRRVRWLCQCECQNIVLVDASSLRSGNTKSCGCYAKEVSHAIGKANQQHNDYVIMGTYVILYTKKNEPFFVDIDDFGRVHRYCWWKDNLGYLRTKINGKHMKLHRYIMNCPEGLNVDHKHGTSSIHDNRKSNLRIVTQVENTMNSAVRSDSTSKVTGVSQLKSGSWLAYVYVKGKQIRLGTFKDKEQAIAARCDAEDKYYGEYSRRKSREE